VDVPCPIASSGMLPGSKRAVDGDESSEPAEKRYKVALENNAAELVCPICYELPLDPVMAEDGQVYDRVAIEDWLVRGNRRSPKTNEPMGSKLIPAVQVKNLIANMVKSGALSGAIAEQWQQKLEDEKTVQMWRSDAEAGNGRAIWQLAEAHRRGTHGLRKDEEQAFRWYERGADAGFPDCTARLGLCLASRHCNKQESLAVHHLSIAAERGSVVGCFFMAHAFAKGKYGLQADDKLAARWFREALRIDTPRDGSLSYAVLSDDSRAKCHAWLAVYAAD